MKAKWMTLLIEVVVLTMILITGYGPVVAAPPAGEVKTVAPMFGNQIPIPYLELSHANNWMQLLYDPLVGCTAEGKLFPNFGLANKWEMSRDGLTWTFSLRKGVKFHDGVEVTAKDVKFSIEQLMLPEALTTNTPYLRRAVKSIEVKDPHTVAIHCKDPQIFLPILFSNMEQTE